MKKALTVDDRVENLALVTSGIFQDCASNITAFLMLKTFHLIEQNVILS